jgi:hypothetical protein
LTEPFSEKYLKKLIGRTDIEDALKRLDRLTQEEARMAAAQLLKITNAIDSEVRDIADNVLVVDERVAGVDDRVKDVNDKVKAVDDKLVAVIDGAQYILNHIENGLTPNAHAGSIILTGNQLRQDLRRWLSPQDPSTNHIIACNAHHKGTTAWFFEGRTYNEWKLTTCSESLLWIHGKRVPLSHSVA